MAKYLELPSGCMLDIEDIIYIGTVKFNETNDGNKYMFNVIWAHKIHKDMIYNTPDEAWKDQLYIKTCIKNTY